MSSVGKPISFQKRRNSSLKDRFNNLARLARGDRGGRTLAVVTKKIRESNDIEGPYSSEQVARFAVCYLWHQEAGRRVALMREIDELREREYGREYILNLEADRARREPHKCPVCNRVGGTKTIKNWTEAFRV